MIEVAGDVCLDVVAVPIADQDSRDHNSDNWRQTGETRTHYLPGGSMLLQQWVQAAAPEFEVVGPRPCLPPALACGISTDKPLSLKEFLSVAERFTRAEIVHSLLELNCFRATSGSKEQEQLRVLASHGFSGPLEKNEEPSLTVLPPEVTSPPNLIVIDDTGNRFRRTPAQWPALLTNSSAATDPIVVYKLHRPLPHPEARGVVNNQTISGPNTEPSPVWKRVTERFPNSRMVIVSIDDLRDQDVVISRGLSWERTALDVVWHLLNTDLFAELRECPHLIVRFGLNGAIYWRRNKMDARDEARNASKEPKYEAWLIYDPFGIEGFGESEHDGQMVGYGSAFTAALTGCIAGQSAQNLRPETDADGRRMPTAGIVSGIKAGLLASRRLLKFGFGNNAQKQPAYPGKELFEPAIKGDPVFACQPIPIIQGATVPDRGYWRLLDSIFESKTALLHTAVALTAVSAKPATPEETVAMALLKQVPIAVFAKALRTYDRREIENYRALYSLMRDYISNPTPSRPLSIAVFGPPGAGKSFGVKKVAEALSQLGGPHPIKTLTFNLSQYERPEQLADAFHLVRDKVLRGETPLVFFDEFDSALAGTRLGWLRYFLAPMQDAEFLDNGTPHPIGKAIFVFAGGTCAKYSEFAAPFLPQPSSGVEPLSDAEKMAAKVAFRAAKGPDFLSRLRGTLDIPGLDLNQPFDPYGPVDSFPCEAAILLRRAGILAFQLREKAPGLRTAENSMRVSPVVCRALLHLPQFVHGNRSFEALLDMSSLAGSHKFTPSLLPSPSHAELHADAVQMSQLLSTEYPFTPDVRETIAKSIHESYVTGRTSDPTHDPADPSLQPWKILREDLKESNRQQADHIAIKLRTAGLWFRKRLPGSAVFADITQLDAVTEQLAIAEHDRWVAEKRRNGWIAAPCHERECRNDELRLHNCLFPWDELTEEQKKFDRDTVRQIPDHLNKAECEIVNL